MPAPFFSWQHAMEDEISNGQVAFQTPVSCAEGSANRQLARLKYTIILQARHEAIEVSAFSLCTDLVQGASIYPLIPACEGTISLVLSDESVHVVGSLWSYRVLRLLNDSLVFIAWVLSL